jgi:hypothetical protein
MTTIQFSFDATLVDHRERRYRDTGIISFNIDLDPESDPEHYHRLCYLAALDELTVHLTEKWPELSYRDLSGLDLSLSGLSAETRS